MIVTQIVLIKSGLFIKKIRGVPHQGTLELKKLMESTLRLLTLTIGLSRTI